MNIKKERFGPAEKVKRTKKNEKSCFELFISENILKTIFEFTNKTE